MGGQGRINHWANRANARGLALEYQNIQNIPLCFMFLGCSLHVKIADFFDDCLYSS